MRNVGLLLDGAHEGVLRTHALRGRFPTSWSRLRRSTPLHARAQLCTSDEHEPMRADADEARVGERSTSIATDRPPLAGGKRQPKAAHRVAP
jgi:hypothetical protein